MDFYERFTYKLNIYYLGSRSHGDEGVEVTWDHPEELESYIKKLRSAAERLTSENRKLRKSHYFVLDKVK